MSLKERGQARNSEQLEKFQGKEKLYGLTSLGGIFRFGLDEQISYRIIKVLMS
jgi:hypothetical protein